MVFLDNFGIAGRLDEVTTQPGASRLRRSYCSSHKTNKKEKEKSKEMTTEVTNCTKTNRVQRGAEGFCISDCHTVVVRLQKFESAWFEAR